jgi:lysyl-tRNA synthetase class II
MLPKRFPDRLETVVARAEAEKAEPGKALDQELRVAGRVMARREMGKLTFLDLVDRSGRIQLIAEGNVDLDLGDVVGATGKPGRSRRGEPSLFTSQVELLAKIRRPLPDTFHGVTDTETTARASSRSRRRSCSRATAAGSRSRSSRTRTSSTPTSTCASRTSST